jgi:N-acetylmuramoyl-L-alanine amidase
MNKTFVLGGAALAAVAVGVSMNKPQPKPQPKPPTRPAQPLTICIDPGHGNGATNAGTTNMCNSVTERDEVLRAALMLEPMLKNRGFKVVLTRRTADAPGAPKQDLAARVAIAHNAGADLFLSLHFDFWQADTKGRAVCSGGYPSKGAGILFNSRAGQATASSLAKALGAVTPGGVYTERRDWLAIANFRGPMLLVEIDRIQRLPDADLQRRMSAIADWLVTWDL